MLSHFSHVRLFATPWTVAHQAPLSNTGVRGLALLQGIFLTQGLNLHLLLLLHCRQILYHWAIGARPQYSVSITFLYALENQKIHVTCLYCSIDFVLIQNQTQTISEMCLFLKIMAKRLNTQEQGSQFNQCVRLSEVGSF